VEYRFPNRTTMAATYTKGRLSDVLPPLIFGTATFNYQYNKDPFELDTTGLVQRALEYGIRAFDTSPYYGPSEEILGEALDTDFVRNNVPRKDFHLITKVGRISSDEFDYSKEWYGRACSAACSDSRLHTWIWSTVTMSSLYRRKRSWRLCES